MKKLLLASTALIGFAGAASAEVVIAGTAEMGVVGGDLKETQFHNSYTINFKMSGETDTGLSFGATYRLDADGSSEENQDPKGDNGTVFISGAYGKLTLGDTDGALDWALTEVAMGTALTDEGTTHVGYSGNGDGYYDDQVLRYEYAFGDIGVALSLEQDDGDGDDDGVTDLDAALDEVDTGDTMIGLGVKYATEFSGVELGFGLGYQTGQTGDTGADNAEDLDVIGLSAKAAMDMGLVVILNYVTYDYDTSDDVDHWAVGVGYDMNGLLLHANYGEFDFDDGEDVDGYGLVVNYDLGGGAVLAAGYASDVSLDDGDQDQFSFGMSLSF